MNAKQREQMSADELSASTADRQRVRAMGGGVRGPVAMSEDECRRACDRLGKEYMRGYEARVLGYVITNETADRYGDIVRARGCKLDNYIKNPVVLYCHEQQNLPVGTSLKTWVDKGARNVQAHALFLDSRVDMTGRSDLVYKFARAGFMPGCSIGFMPGDVNRPGTPEERDAMGLGPYGVEYLTWEMLEWSPCAVPANPDALTMSFKSLDAALTREITREDLLAAERAAIFDGEWLGVVEHVLLGRPRAMVAKSEPAAEPAPVTPAPEGERVPATVINAVLDMGQVVEMAKQITSAVETLRSFSETVLGELRSATEMIRCASDALKTAAPPARESGSADGAASEEEVRSTIRTMFSE